MVRKWLNQNLHGGYEMPDNQEYDERNEQEYEEVPQDPAIAPALTAGLGAVYLRNKLKSVQGEN